MLPIQAYTTYTIRFLFRVSKPFKKPLTYILLYQSLVRPFLEYVSPVWNPFYNVHSNKIESIQKKFLKILHFRMTNTKLSYSELLHHYEILSLTARRDLSDIMLLHKIINNAYDCPTFLELLNFRTPPHSSRNQSLFAETTSRTNLGKCVPYDAFVMYTIRNLSPSIYLTRKTYNLKGKLPNYSINYLIIIIFSVKHLLQCSRVGASTDICVTIFDFDWH